MEYDRESIKNFFTKLLQDFQEIKATFKQDVTDKYIVGKKFREAFKVI